MLSKSERDTARYRSLAPRLFPCVPPFFFFPSGNTIHGTPVLGLPPPRAFPYLKAEGGREILNGLGRVIYSFRVALHSDRILPTKSRDCPSFHGRDTRRLYFARPGRRGKQAGAPYQTRRINGAAAVSISSGGLNIDQRSDLWYWRH